MNLLTPHRLCASHSTRNIATTLFGGGPGISCSYSCEPLEAPDPSTSQNLHDRPPATNPRPSTLPTALPHMSPSPGSSPSSDTGSTSSSAPSSSSSSAPRVTQSRSKRTNRNCTRSAAAPPIPSNDGTHRGQPAMGTLGQFDDVDLTATLLQKCLFFQTPPHFIRGRVRQALTTALDYILASPSPEMTRRAWKLWLLLPRMLLHRLPTNRTLPKADWRARIETFQRGDWTNLLDPQRRPPELYTHHSANNSSNSHLGGRSTCPPPPSGTTCDGQRKAQPPAHPASQLKKTAPAPNLHWFASTWPKQTFHQTLPVPSDQVGWWPFKNPTAASEALSLATSLDGWFRGALPYAEPIRQACQPHQFALSSRAGTDTIVHALAAAADFHPDNLSSIASKPILEQR